jgi:hypothetical protein
MLSILSINFWSYRFMKSAISIQMEFEHMTS